MRAKRMRTTRQQLIEEPATLADRTANGAGADTEPAREMALEEAARAAEGNSPLFDHQSALAECRDCESGFHNGRVAAAAAIRALSSPDHADAGKVEGDGKKWPMREIVAKAIAYHSVGDPHAKTIRGDQRWEWFVEEADKFISVFGYYMPALPSAPSEGAE